MKTTSVNLFINYVYFVLGKYTMLNTETQSTVEPQLTATAENRPSLKDLAKIKHIFGPGVYIKAFFVPKGIAVITKAFREDHITILAKGSVIVEDPNGKCIKYIAPAHTVFQEDTRYRCTCVEDAVWYCIHPTNETDQDLLIKRYE
jgi:hypothetical protein